MNLSPDIPDNIDALKAALIATRSELATSQARVSDDQALIAHLKLMIAKLNRDLYGPRSERTARLINQFELQLEELEATATEDEIAAEKAAARTTNVAAFHPQEACAQAVPRPSAARTGCHSRSDILRLLWRYAPV